MRIFLRAFIVCLTVCYFIPSYLKGKKTTKISVSGRTSFSEGNVTETLRKHGMIKEGMTLGKPGKKVGVQWRVKQDK